MVLMLGGVTEETGPTGARSEKEMTLFGSTPLFVFGFDVFVSSDDDDDEGEEETSESSSVGSELSDTFKL